MADLSDVEAALVGAVTAAIYPAGPSGASALKMPVNVFRGQPTTRNLVTDRRSGILDIGVVSVGGTTRNTTRWGVQVYELVSTPGLLVVTSGHSATFSGQANSGDLAGVLALNTAFVYQATAGDTGPVAAGALATAIRANMICWLTGATLTVPGVTAIVARTGAGASAVEEWGRQEQEFRVSIWAANPAIRDQAASLLTAALSATSFLTLADGTGGRIRYHSASNIDDDQASSIYRRDLVYTVEYASTLVQQGPTVLFGDLNWNGSTIFV